MRRLAAIALALAIPALAVAELGAEALTWATAPDEAAWREVAAVARERLAPGELLVVAPPWAEPRARAHLGDDAMPLAHVARPDTDRFPTALEIGAGGARHPDTRALRVASEEVIGPFTVRRLTNEGARPVVWDASDHLRPGPASVLGTAPPVECPWSARSRVISGGLAGHPTLPRERFECPEGALLGAAVTIIVDERFEPRRCIWAPPPPSGERRLRFSGVPLGRARRAVGHVGLSWLLERDRPGRDVEVDVLVDGSPLTSEVHRDGEGWKRFEADLPPGDPAREGSVEIAVRSEGEERRHVCVELTLR